MLVIKKILVPTDFSVGAQDAVDYAIEVARRLDAQVTLLHCYQVPVYLLPDGSLIGNPATTSDIIRAATDALAAAKSALAVRMSVDTILTKGPPYAQIVDTARDGNYDLIVMGTHGRTGQRHALLGSVAERVVRLASCPVLTVREPAGVPVPVARFVTDVSSDRTKVLS